MKTATIPKVTDFMKLEIEELVSRLSEEKTTYNRAEHEDLFLAYLCKAGNKERSVYLLANDYSKICFPKNIKYLGAVEGEKLFIDLVIKNCPKHQHASVADFFPKGSYPYLKLIDLAA